MYTCLDCSGLAQQLRTRLHHQNYLTQSPNVTPPSPIQSVHRPGHLRTVSIVPKCLLASMLEMKWQHAFCRESAVGSNSSVNGYKYDNLNRKDRHCYLDALPMLCVPDFNRPAFPSCRNNCGICCGCKRYYRCRHPFHYPRSMQGHHPVALGNLRLLALASHGVICRNAKWKLPALDFLPGALKVAARNPCCTRARQVCRTRGAQTSSCNVGTGDGTMKKKQPVKPFHIDIVPSSKPAIHQSRLPTFKMNALLRCSKQVLQHGSRSFASSPHPDRKVALLGAAGGIGQPLGLLLKVLVKKSASLTDIE